MLYGISHVDFFEKVFPKRKTRITEELGYGSRSNPPGQGTLRVLCCISSILTTQAFEEVFDLLGTSFKKGSIFVFCG